MDKQLLWKVLETVIAGVVYFILKWRYDGKEAVIKEVISAEVTFEGKGLGALKKQAVQEFVSKLPAKLRIFINEKTIEDAVQELQPFFKKLKESKK
ncbi:hypothetical protein CBG60_00410 [Fusobacterium animalis]|uniref:Uncharacterized protein n=1 Tax=Fusobacterium animalis 7_1 TaxID=457405 RepID=A0A140PTQ1_9FUSO|nr:MULTISPECIES: hypothetical protein [Fusobacterium]ALF22167.1 hypothetical protein RO08_07580 [Fusobacterium animalis]ASG29883.1 hypothetical protein CBG60_00410 [Fusobacterium animalis]EEO42730.1 hypothetical protein FSDG_01289 [Fusobacterium animalis 7_1]EPC07744.1 hypothetical protein HMPREF9369_02554 [Fusobacterium polymorphum F0401]ERT41337.1 hypothetical protein HMPREF1538_00949 [Fusobacterium nucleatum CTI-1]